MLSEEIKKELVAMLNERVNPSFIIIFGSYAKGTAREDSDIDLGYYAVDLLSSYERFILAGELAQVAKREVDLVNIREVDTVFAMQIFSTGKLISCRDENEFLKQRMRAFSMYIDLNQQRADILQSIQKRESVFCDE